MAMSGDRVRRMKLQHQAEGYLELGSGEDRRSTCWAGWAMATRRIREPCICEARPCAPWNDVPEALVPLGRVAEVEVENVNAWLALGWCHKRTGRLDLAIDALESALAANPKNR